MENRTKLPLPLQHVLFLTFLYFQTNLCIELNTIYPGQSLSGNQTISSQNGRFELGFFNPGNSTNFYVGIWYKKIPVQTVVWVANREKPLHDPSSSKLQLSKKGNLVLYNQSEIPVWSAESSSNTMNSTVAVLENSGNLVLKDRSNPSIMLWQSFDHPTDTWLPGAKLGKDKISEKGYISWRNSSDPASGPYFLGLDPNETGTYFILRNGKRHWSCGTWLERVSSFSNETVVDDYTTISYVSNSNEEQNFYIYSVTNSSVLVRYVMHISGQVQKLVWKDDLQKWEQIWAKPKDQCEIYAFCGAYGACNQYSRPLCKCLLGFEPKVNREWNSDSSNPRHGCVRRTPLQCNKGVKDGFEEIKNVRLPASDVFLTDNKSLKECESACLRDCSCKAYSYNGNCSIWQEDLLNIQYLSYGDNLGRTLYLRLSMADMEALRGKTKERIEWFTIKAAVAIVSLIAILGMIFDSTYFPARAANCISNGGDVLSLLDSKLKGNANAEEVIRACRVACWCIQDEEQNRPSMGQVVQIFEGVQEVNIPPIPWFIQTITHYAKADISK
ncbi:S-locus glycoprotein [Corchorus olitorius]|uniref:S-locus glycoprotein n=1 Tax=Corchorus olitorius TaxID=93759 RepID=A0A1R3HSJ9_9ROSI|nr:S-locus glycoprotein [Corchorus olitorius]